MVRPMSEPNPTKKLKLPLPAPNGGFPNDPRPDGVYREFEDEIPVLVTVREGSVVHRQYLYRWPDGSQRV